MFQFIILFILRAHYAYRSKYIIRVADKAPQKLRKLAVLITAVVVPDIFMIVPIHKDKRNWAKKTMLLMIATSVPNPRNPDPSFAAPLLSNSN